MDKNIIILVVRMNSTQNNSLDEEDDDINDLMSSTVNKFAALFFLHDK